MHRYGVLLIGEIVGPAAFGHLAEHLIAEIFSAIVYSLQYCGLEIAGHRTQLRSPATPVVLWSIREIEVSVAATDRSVVRVEGPVAALGLVAVADHRRRVTAGQSRRTEHPQPGVVVDQQL